METSCSTVDSGNNITISRKIYILRHEERFDNISFATHLTPKGLYNSEHKICPLLEKLSISAIYCSPFIRTLETIKPYCDKTGKKVNLEWSLAESIPHHVAIPSQLKCITNSDYISHTPYISSFNNNILSFEDIVSRVSSFLNSITDKNNNILLVTHMPVINAILTSKGLKQYTINTYHEPGSLSYVQRV